MSRGLTISLYPVYTIETAYRYLQTQKHENRWNDKGNEQHTDI